MKNENLLFTWAGLQEPPEVSELVCTPTSRATGGDTCGSAVSALHPKAPRGAHLLPMYYHPEVRPAALNRYLSGKKPSLQAHHEPPEEALVHIVEACKTSSVVLKVPRRVPPLLQARKVISPATPLLAWPMSRPQTAPRWRVFVVASTATSSLACPAERGTAPASTTPAASTKGWSVHGCRRRGHFPGANTVLCSDSRTLPLPDNVHLVVTSPLQRLQGLRRGPLAQGILDAAPACLPGATASSPRGGWWSAANLGRKPYIPLSSHINIIMAEIGFLMGDHLGQPPAPVLHAPGALSSRPPTPACGRPRIPLVFSKGDYKLQRSKKSERKAPRHDSSGRFYPAHEVHLVLRHRACLPCPSCTVPG